MSKLEKIVDDLSALTVMEAADLAKLLEDKWGVSASAVAVAGAVAPGGSQAAEPEEKTEFDVVLKAAGAKKINVIKAVREIVSGLGLKEAKELVEGAPKTLAEGIAKEDAEAMLKKLQEAGAEVELT